jgi:hypothetical protein
MGHFTHLDSDIHYLKSKSLVPNKPLSKTGLFNASIVSGLLISTNDHCFCYQQFTMMNVPGTIL